MIAINQIGIEAAALSRAMLNQPVAAHVNAIRTKHQRKVGTMSLYFRMYVKVCADAV